VREEQVPKRRRPRDQDGAGGDDGQLKRRLSAGSRPSDDGLSRRHVDIEPTTAELEARATRQALCGRVGHGTSRRKVVPSRDDHP
jgi:hypothetical protein